jgi:hypothetical protein
MRKGLISTVKCLQLEVRDSGIFAPIYKEWRLENSVQKVTGILITNSLNQKNTKPLGRIDITFPETVRYAKIIFEDIGKRKKGYCFDPICWQNNGEPIRVFYENKKFTSFSDYDIQVMLYTINHC